MLQSPTTTGRPNPEATPRRWFWLYVLVVILLTTLPYVYGWLRTPPGFVFTGSHSLAPGDLPVYQSYIEQVRQGATMFKDLFTAELHSPFIFSPPWLGVGWLSRGLNLSPIVAFHLSRIALIPVFFLVLDWWLKRFFSEWTKRRLAILLITFGAGLGVLMAPAALARVAPAGDLTFWPMDLYVSEAFTFLTLYQSPHFIAATILILLVLEWFWQGVESGQWVKFIWSGLAGLTLMSFHPFHLPTLAVVILFYAVLALFWHQKLFARTILGAGIVLMIASPMIIYQALLIVWNPIAAGRAAQNINPTPAWWVVLISYGWLIPLAIVGATRRLCPPDRRWLFLLVWLVGQLAVFVTPAPFNRRLTQAWQLPLAVFATVGLLAMADWLKRRYRFAFHWSWAGWLFIILFSLSPLVVVSNDVYYWSSDKYPSLSYYLEKPYAQIAAWLKDNASTDSVILTGTRRSLFIAGLSGRTVVYGHGIETLYNNEKRQAIVSAFRDASDGRAARALIDKWGVDYIVWGGPDTAWAKIDPASLKGLALVFEQAPLKVYAVR